MTRKLTSASSIVVAIDGLCDLRRRVTRSAVSFAELSGADHAGGRFGLRPSAVAIPVGLDFAARPCHIRASRSDSLLRFTENVARAGRGGAKTGRRNARRAIHR
jgi:hypothetical protein